MSLAASPVPTHIGAVSTIAEVPSPSMANWFTQPARALEDFVRHSVEEWLRVCRAFLDWHRQNRLLRAYDAAQETSGEEAVEGRLDDALA